jgi:hypothetical protein
MISFTYINYILGLYSNIISTIQFFTFLIISFKDELNSFNSREIRGKAPGFMAQLLMYVMYEGVTPVMKN